MLATNQKTINKPIKLNGVGLHNGVNAELVIKPAPENFGIKFCRVDIDKNDLMLLIDHSVCENHRRL